MIYIIHILFSVCINILILSVPILLQIPNRAISYFQQTNKKMGDYSLYNFKMSGDFTFSANEYENERFHTFGK
jgi:hypothetical protein